MKFSIVLAAGLVVLPYSGVFAQPRPDQELSTVDEAELRSNWGVLASLAGNERLSSEQAASARAMTMKIQDGIFDREDGSGFVVLSQQGDTLAARGSTRSILYKRQPNAEFHYRLPDSDFVGVYKIVDPLTVEFFVVEGEESSSHVRFTRRDGPGLQPSALEYGLYKRVGYETQPGGIVFRLTGNIIQRAEPSSPVMDYVLKADGRYHDKHGSGTLRIVDMYTVELGPAEGSAGPSYIFTRVEDASPTYFADESRKWDTWEREYLAREEPRMRQEAAEWEAHVAALDEVGSSNADAGASIMEGFVRGFSEATASNNSMERSMRNAANQGLAAGAANYARRQAQIARDEARPRNEDADHLRGVRMREGTGSGSSGYNQPGITIQDSPEPTASRQAPAEPETRQVYAWCMALRPNQSVTYSTVQQITIPNRSWSDTSMKQAFGSVAGGGVSICGIGDSYARAQAQLEGSKTGHRDIKQATSSAILQP